MEKLTMNAIVEETWLVRCTTTLLLSFIGVWAALLLIVEHQHWLQ